VSRLRRYRKIAVFEARIREPITERKQRLRTGAVEMAIPEEHAFGILDVLRAPLRIVAVMSRTVFPSSLERGRKLAGGTVLAEKNLGQSPATLLSGIPSVDQGRNLVDPLIHVDVAAGGQNHNR